MVGLFRGGKWTESGPGKLETVSGVRNLYIVQNTICRTGLTTALRLCALLGQMAGRWHGLNGWKAT